MSLSPSSSGEAEAGSLSFLAGGGELGAAMRHHDWSCSPLGDPSDWPQSLRSVVGLLINSKFPMFVAWGPELGFLYNDSYAPVLGSKHTDALGKPFKVIWAEIWPDISPLIDAAMTGDATYHENLPLLMHRKGFDERTWFTFSYSPVRDENGAVAGVFCACTETTSEVLSARRREALLALDDCLRDVVDTARLSHVASKLLGEALDADRVGYGDFDARANTLTVERNWSAPGFADLAGVHHFGDYGTYADDLRRGDPVAIGNIMTDPRTAGRTGAFEAIGLRALLDVPVTENGRTVAQIFVHSGIVRVWTADEIAFVRDFAERTRLGVQRRRAEQALHDGRSELQTLADTLPVLIAYIDSDRCYRFVNRAYEQWFPRQWSEGMVGRAVRDVVGDAAYAKVGIQMDRALAGEPVGSEQFMHYAGGDQRYIHLQFTPRRSPTGKVEGFYSLIQDISDAKRVEAALQESETRFRSMADDAPVMMWVTDPTGVCTYLNAGWYAFTGQTPGTGEIYGWLDAVHADDRAIAENAFIEANADRRNYRVDFRLRRADGVYRWVIDAAAARFADDGTYLGYIGSVIDIDERRETEARLAFSEEQLRLATEAAEIGLWDVDLVSDTLFWPARVKAMFGISPDVPISMADFYAGLHPDDADRTGAAFAAAADPARRARYDVEYRTIGKEDGVVRWVAAKGQGMFTPDGSCTRVIGTAIDITARKADEVRLRELNDQLEQQVARQIAERNRVWEMSRDLLAIMGFDGFLKAINPAWETTLGRGRDTLLAMSFRDQVHPDDHAVVAAAIDRLLAGEAVERVEDRLRHADGSWRWISWTLVPEGDVFYAVGRDVTAERLATAELDAAQEALRQSQKMEAMGQLTGGVAHDFNNLLTPIVGALDMLQRKGLGGEREQRLIGGAVQSADRAKTLVQRLLAFARRQPLQSVSVDIGQLVTGMADLVASTTGPQIKVVVDVAPDLPPACADPNQLEMAVLNLAVNARDAMPDGGTLRISVGAAAVGAPHRSGLAAGPYLHLSVADTGSGMDDATLARAVEPFFSTKGVGKGTGLGLSMVHGLASQLGGAVTISSTPSVGTDVELWLPQGGTIPTAVEIDEPAIVIGATRGTVLLVDDEELVRLSTADMLTEFGYSVVEAGSAEEAMRLVERGLDPDVVVTDHLMPGISGTELARLLRADRPAMKVLVVSGYAETTGIAPELPRLTKPFRAADLASSLSELQ